MFTLGRGWFVLWNLILSVWIRKDMGRRNVALVTTAHYQRRVLLLTIRKLLISAIYALLILATCHLWKLIERVHPLIFLSKYLNLLLLSWSRMARSTRQLRNSTSFQFILLVFQLELVILSPKIGIYLFNIVQSSIVLIHLIIQNFIVSI